MSSSLGISMQEIMAEVERLDRAQPEGFSIAEMADATGHGRDWCRSRVREMIDQGVLRFNGEATRTSINGRSCRVPVYSRITEPAAHQSQNRA